MLLGEKRKNMSKVSKIATICLSFCLMTIVGLSKDIPSETDLSGQVKKEVEDAFELSVFPNPVAHILKISGAGKNASYTITDPFGGEVLTGTGNTVNIAWMDSGVYYLKIDNQSIGFVKR